MSEEKKKSKLSSLKDLSVRKMPLREQIFLIKRLSFLIKAGVPVLESLHLIREQTKKKNHRKILDSVIYDVSNGQFLATSLLKYRRVFGDFSINIIGFGETTGILSENLEYLAEELKKKQALKKKIIGAFIYPSIVIAATLAITAFLMLYLFPKITPIFESIHAQLPLSTLIVMSISNFLKKYIFILLAALIIFLLAIVVTIKKNKNVHYYFDKLILKIPLIGQIIRDYNLTNITRTLSLLLKSGVTISDALPIAEKTHTNLVYKKELKNASIIVSNGERMSTYLKSQIGLFPDMMVHIINVGERSGNLSNSLAYLSELYEAEIEDFTKNLGNTIEPALMIFMGLLVGFIAISIITPIYSITQHLTPK